MEALDSFAKKFVSAEDKAAVVAETKAALEALEGEEAKANGVLYVKFMEKAAEKVRLCVCVCVCERGGGERPRTRIDA